jgi:Uncharacterized protein conserved in bacteria
MVFLSQTCFAIGVDWNSNIITAIGVGSAPEYAIKPGQADALARRAAVVDAYRNLASIVYGVEIENHTTVAQLVVKKDTIKTAVAGVIKNARIIDEEMLDDSNYQVTISMPLFGPNSLSSAVWTAKNTTPDVSEDDIFPFSTNAATPPAAATAATTTSPPTTAAKTTPAVVPNGAFTGLVVDCRGLNLERAMAPNIVDLAGKIIYSSKNITDSAVIRHGLASYARSDSPNELGAAGPNPLMIKAISLQDFQQNPVVAKEDGDKILLAVQQYDFMKTCSVVFIQ